MGSLRTWSLALVAGIFVVVVAHQRSNANAGEGGAPPASTVAAAAVPTAPAGRVTGLPDFSGLVAENGAAAVKVVSEHKGAIDLVMTDVVMPGLSGSELTKRIEAIRPGTRIMYMSGYTDQAIIHHGILGPDIVLLQKPFTLSALAHKLRDALTKKNA